MTALALGGALVALVGGWWWFDGSLTRECRRPLTARDVAALDDLAKRRSSALDDLAKQ